MLAKRLTALLLRLCRLAGVGQGRGCSFAVKQGCWALGGGGRAVP